MIENVRPSGPGCVECMKTGDGWTHLRMCLTCGEVHCCDTSPNRHAAQHAEEAGHPLMQSFEPGENWRWCYLDRTYL